MNSHFGSKRPCTIDPEHKDLSLWRVKASLLPVSTGSKLAEVFWNTNKIIFCLFVFWILGTLAIEKAKKQGMLF